MIKTIVQISCLRLWNSKQELLLIFVVPILFFSIFAMIFSRGIGSQVKQVSVSIVNDDSSAKTQQIIQQLVSREELNRVTGVGHTDQEWPIERLSRTLISKMNAEVVIYFPEGFGTGLQTQEPTPVRILNEGTNPFSSQIVEATVAQTLATALPSQPAARVQLASATTGAQTAISTPLRVEHENVFAAGKHNPKIAMYAAGIAVMFLLFSASGAGASLLEEREAGTLERLLASRLSITGLLVGKWIYIVLLGMVQITTMFVWGQLIFDVDLLGHISGFLVMALATTCASASFALFLAVICKSRNQLNGVATVTVLTMSAAGGSMIPRYIMSDSMRQMGKFTFNGWALDGFKKVFWYDLPLSALRNEVIVLFAIALVLGLASTMLAQRWSKA